VRGHVIRQRDKKQNANLNFSNAVSKREFPNGETEKPDGRKPTNDTRTPFLLPPCWLSTLLQQASVGSINNTAAALFRKQQTTMILQIAAAVAFLFWFTLLRPRKGGKNAPPTVTASSVVPIPIFGVLAEFFKSPNTMVQRCVRDYGSVFTIPVSCALLDGWMEMTFFLSECRCSKSQDAATRSAGSLSFIFGRFKPHQLHWLIRF